MESQTPFQGNLTEASQSETLSLLSFRTTNSDTLVIPLAVSCLFIVLQAIHGMLSLLRRRSEFQQSGLPNPHVGSVHRPSRFTVHAGIQRHGSTIAFTFSIARVAGCLALYCLSVVKLSALADENWYWRLADPEIYMTCTYFYASVLASVGLLSERRGPLATSYLTWLLLATLLVFVYRDVWPLATFNEEPEDISEGFFLWIKLGVLASTTVLPPLLAPWKYRPVDPKNPMPEPNPEQICSTFSFLSYSFLSPIIFLGYEVPHLSYRQLPPLCDTDFAVHLRERAFRYLDVYSGSKREHLFFGLLRVFGKSYAQVALILLTHTVFVFASPIAIGRLLSYIETGGKDATIRPWFWVLCIFLAPALRSMMWQTMIFIQTRSLVRAESLLTELVFEHSFRIRLKADSSSEKLDILQETSVGDSSTLDSASLAESSESSEGESHSQREPSEATVLASRTPSTSSSAFSLKKSSSKPDLGSIPSVKPLEKAPGSNSNANMLGRINNLLTTDLSNIIESRDWIVLVASMPPQLVGSILFLYTILGWSAFVGLGIMIVFLPLPGYLAKNIQKLGRTRMKQSDARVQDVTEAVNVIRMIKLFGWERRVYDRIKEKRDDELYTLLKFKLLQVLTQLLNFVIPALTMLATYATYALVAHGELKPSKIFPSITAFSLLRGQMNRIAYHVGASIQGKIALDRLGDFLHNTELLDKFSSRAEPIHDDGDQPDTRRHLIGIRDTSFAWSTETDKGLSTPSRRRFRLRVAGEVLFKKNAINLILGPTGSGKTSLLMALLGEMHHMPQGPSSWFNLPRGDGVAYAAQESWVQSATIRDNILFGSPFNEARYHKVLHQCALEKDLELFAAGDSTEVGEKGITLSGGQKARVTLARAVYSFASVVLLDDVLAALDVHTAVWVVEKCLKGDLLQGRTVLLVTHNVPLVRPVAQLIVSVGINGTVQVSQANNQPDGSEAVEEALRELLQEVHQETSPPGDQQLPEEIGGNSSNGKLVLEEEISEGRITWQSIKLFLDGMGGKRPFIFLTLCVSGFLTIDWLNIFQTWFLGYWSSRYEGRDPSEVPAASYLGTYALALFASVVVYTATFSYFGFSSMRASRIINATLMNSILKATLRQVKDVGWNLPLLNGMQDINAVDIMIPNMLGGLIDLTLQLVDRLVVIAFFSPVFLFPGFVVAGLGLYLGNMYLSAQLSVKRELSNARSPLLAHTSAAIAGLVSIRAFGAEDAFKAESMKRLDHYVRIGRMTYNLNRWISIRNEFLGALFSGGLAAYLVYGRPISSANTGLSLNMAVDFCMVNMFWIRIFNELEVQSNSLERIHGYLQIEHEPKATKDRKPPASWPKSGQLNVDNLSARYSQDGPKVLDNISFQAKSGERIGLVGRTGSGKSSLALALLRCILTEGTVRYDGVLTDTVNLEDLRSQVTIIPQSPELLSGDLRRNLDPFEEHDDATLNNALRAAGLSSLQEELGEEKLNLDSSIASGGGNLSVGQRQIIALARAMIRNSKILILDEATSAIDYKTDAIIQHTLRHELSRDTTVITIAHRLQTIMDVDKIMVLDAGKLIEFDTPGALLKKPDGLFRSLVDESGDKESLLQMVKG